MILIRLTRQTDLQTDNKPMAKPSTSNALTNNGVVTSENFENVTDNTPYVSALEECSIAYFAGYLVQKTIKNTNCLHCKALLEKPSGTLDNQNQILILFRQYESQNPTFTGLSAPSDLAVKICSITLRLFADKFHNIKHTNGVLHQLLESAIEKINKALEIEFHVNETECGKHRKSLVELLLRTKIYKECKWHRMNKNFSKKSESQKKQHKLKALHH